MDKINLKSLINLKIEIEKLKSKQKLELAKLVKEYESGINRVIDSHKERLEKAGELYDADSDVSIVPCYADREIDCVKLYDELPEKYYEAAHIPAKDICDFLGKDKLEDQIYDADTTDDKVLFRGIAVVSNKDAKKVLTKRELEDMWLPRKIEKYDLDLKIK